MKSYGWRPSRLRVDAVLSGLSIVNLILTVVRQHTLKALDEDIDVLP